MTVAGSDSINFDGSKAALKKVKVEPHEESPGKPVGQPSNFGAQVFSRLPNFVALIL